MKSLKRKFAIFNLALMAVVQMAIAWQSFHAFSHSHSHEHAQEAKHFSATGHEHADDDCSVCDFHFDCFTAPQDFSLRLYFPFKAIPYSFSSIVGSNAFAGSLFAHRGPPTV